MTRPLPCLALFAAFLHVSPRLDAQALVSPATAAITEGNYDNGVPWGFGNATQTYMQIHSDLRGRTGTFNRLSFRRDGVLATNAAYLGRTLTASLWFGGGNFAARTTTFANNYVGGSRTQVANNRSYVMPDWTQKPAPLPAQFDFLCPLDAPYGWNGQNDFVWEMRIHSKTSLHNVFADAVRTNTTLQSTGRAYGTSCTATGQTAPYQAQVTAQTEGQVRFNLTWFCTAGVANTSTIILIGTQQTDTPIPGLCANIRTLPIIMFTGTSTGGGSFQFGPIPIAYDPALVNAHFYSQCAGIDLQRIDPIKAVISNGSDAQFVPGPNLEAVRFYEPNTDTATVGFADPANIVLGSVIRLD